MSTQSLDSVVNVVDVEHRHPAPHGAPAGDPIDDRVAILVVAERADAAADLRVAVRPAAALLAAKPRTLGEAPDGQLAHAVDDATRVPLTQVIAPAPKALAPGSISTIFSLLHGDLHKARPPGAR